MYRTHALSRGHVQFALYDGPPVAQTVASVSGGG
jgi:hypothetical protein